MVWIVEPEPMCVVVYTPPAKLEPEDELDGGDALPGIRCCVANLFARAEHRAPSSAAALHGRATRLRHCDRLRGRWERDCHRNWSAARRDCAPRNRLARSCEAAAGPAIRATAAQRPFAPGTRRRTRTAHDGAGMLRAHAGRKPMATAQETKLHEGKKAPAFTLESSDGGKIRLSELQGRWVVLYFYPKDATPGCTTEAQDFRDAKDALAERDAIVLGVSKDSIASHQKFCGKQSLNFPLLSDPEGEVIAKYGAWGEKNMYGKKMMGIIRTTVLIDPAGKVRRVWPKVRVKGHVDEVVAALDALRA
jgi:peroxiredoxin